MAGNGFRSPPPLRTAGIFPLQETDDFEGCHQRIWPHGPQYRAIYENGRKDIDVVAINDLSPVETNAHLLRYDSCMAASRAK